MYCKSFIYFIIVSLSTPTSSEAYHGLAHAIISSEPDSFYKTETALNLTIDQLAKPLRAHMEVDAGEPIRVETLAQVPLQYIQPPERRPSTPPVPITPPVINLENLHLHRDELKRACSEWGAFHVVNHGVPIRLLDEMRIAASSFFKDLPMIEKLKYACDSNSPASEGYGSRMLVASNDAVLDWRDYFDHHTFPLSRRNPSRWPNSPANYRKVMMEYSEQMKALAQKLLGFLCESLDLPASTIEDAMGEIYQNITVSYYPPCPRPDLTLGLQTHSDMGFITLLIQDDVGGLQVLKDDDWVTVDPKADAIFVILADQTEIITNGRYKSAQHRAITNASRARISVATFHDPAKTMAISPAFEPPRYHEVLYGDYVSSWYTNGPDGKRNIDALRI